MLSYFDDDSLSVIDIRNHIVLSHFDFAISILKRYDSISNQFIEDDSTAIKQLRKCVY
jgi:hypothetical protein